MEKKTHTYEMKNNNNNNNIDDGDGKDAWKTFATVSESNQMKREWKKKQPSRDHKKNWADDDDDGEEEKKVREANERKIEMRFIHTNEIFRKKSITIMHSLASSSHGTYFFLSLSLFLFIQNIQSFDRWFFLFSFFFCLSGLGTLRIQILANEKWTTRLIMTMAEKKERERKKIICMNQKNVEK